MSTRQRKLRKDDGLKAYLDTLERLPDNGDAMLETIILRDGIRDPIVVWKGHGIIVDGHRRHGIR